MKAGLAAWLAGISGPIATRILAALGIGTITYAGVDTALSAVLDAARSALAGLAADVAGILALAGLFDAMGIIAGGLTAALTLQTLTRFALHTGGGR